MARSLAIRCPACGQEGEFDAAWIGCLRPCPGCGQPVAVTEAPSGPVVIPPSSTDACRCGKKRTRSRRGLFYELVSTHTEETAPGWTGCLVLLGGVGHLLHLLTALSHSPERTVLGKAGWSCEACEERVAWARRWYLLRWVVVPVIPIAGASALILRTLRARPGMEADALFAETFGPAIVLMLALLLPGYLLYRVVFWLLARPLCRALGFPSATSIRTSREPPGRTPAPSTVGHRRGRTRHRRHRRGRTNN